VLALSWQSAFGMAAGFVGNLSGGYLALRLGGPRGVIYLAAVMFLLSTISLFDLSVETEWKARQFQLDNRILWRKLLSLHLLVALGAGLIMPFLNLYLADKFELSFNEVGLLFAISSLATAAAMLLEPALVKRFGKVGTIAISQLLALPFIVILAYVPYLPLVTVALFLRTALINGAYPVYISLAMELLSPEERTAFMLGVQSIWNIGWALSAALSGQLQAAFGLPSFGLLFLGMLLCYGLSTYLYPRFFSLNNSEVNYQGNSSS
jgi:MFS family permease